MISRVEELALPIYLLTARSGPRAMPGAIPATVTIPAPEGPRNCLLAYRGRATAAAWIERVGRHLHPYSVRGQVSLDRVAAVALARYQCQFLALEPQPTGLEAEQFVDLKAWLSSRRPWAPKFVKWCQRFGLTGYLPF